MSLIPRKKIRVTIQKPKEMDQFIVVLNEDTVKDMVRSYLSDKVIGPESIHLPKDFDLDIGLENPCALTVSFNVEIGENK